MEEEWKVIDGFPAYSVSSFGRVKRLVTAGPSKAGRILKWQTISGYPAIGLYRERGGKQHSRHIHALVCTAFHGPKPSPLHQVAHWDGNKSNPTKDNLRWTTAQGNGEDKVRLGEERGERNGRSKLKDADIPEIRRLLALGGTQQSVADQFGVCQVTISEISRGQKWRHVGP